MKIIEVKEIKENISEKILTGVKKLNTLNIDVKVAKVLIGEDEGSLYYLKSLNKTCEKFGIKSKNMILDKNSSEEEIILEIEKLNNDKTVHGIMLFLPLPKNIDLKKIVNKIDPVKDMDCLTDKNLGDFYQGGNKFYPTTAKSVIRILKSLNINLEGKTACIIGRSNIVGKPLFELLLRENITPTICHTKSVNTEEIAKNSDIVISASGKPFLVNRNFVKNGSIIIDVGTSELDGKVTGDVNLLDIEHLDVLATKVPGGVGSINTLEILNRLVEYLIIETGSNNFEKS